MSKLKWSIVILASVAALSMSIIALYSPWWSVIYHEQNSKTDYGFSWGLDEKSENRVYSEDWYKYTCPSCGDSFADAEDDIEDDRYYCPECVHYVGWFAESCGNCSATFEKTAFLCYRCDKPFIDPEEEIYRTKGDIVTETQALSNTKITKAEKEDGIMNRVGVSSTVNIIWLIGVLIAVLTVLAIIISGLYGRLPKLFIISMGFASVLTLGGVFYYSASWPGAYEDDWNDVYGHVKEFHPGYYNDHDGLFMVPDEKDKPIPAVNSFSGYKKHQPDRGWEDMEFRWGPQSGWIIGLISSILFTGITVLLFVFRNDLHDYDDDYDDEEYEDEEDEDEDDEYQFEQRRKREKSHTPKTSKYPQPQPEKNCIKCRSVIADPLAVFCHNCGANQSHSPQATTVTPPPASMTKHDTRPVQPQTSSEFVNCPSCSSLNLASADSCMMCGAVLKSGGTGPYSSAPDYSLPQKYFYPPPPSY